MTGHHDLWRTEPNGVLAADDGRGLRLAVGLPTVKGGSAEFRVSRRDAAGNELLVGFGNEASVRDAMRAAARMADKFARYSMDEVSVRSGRAAGSYSGLQATGGEERHLKQG